MGRAWAKRLTRRTAQDAKRSKAWSKCSRAITVAVREGSGGDPATNHGLKLAIEEARSHNMPLDTIQKAIKKGLGEGADGDNYEHITYEGYAPGGVAILIEALTDNRNRTAPELRTILDKNGGSLATSGSVAFQFERKGLIRILPNDDKTIDDEKLMELSLESGADDFDGDNESGFQITSDISDFITLKEALEKAGYEFAEAQLAMLANNQVLVSGEIAETLEKILDLLEDNDDVQKVHHNAEFADEDTE